MCQRQDKMSRDCSTAVFVYIRGEGAGNASPLCT
jgi:hypothetical protein